MDVLPSCQWIGAALKTLGIVIMCLLGVTTSGCWAVSSGFGAEASSSAGYLGALFFLFLHINKLVHSKTSDEINIDHLQVPWLWSIQRIDGLLVA